MKTLKMSNNTDNTESDSVPDYKISQFNQDNMLVQKLPALNLPEKIVLVIDTVRERNCTPFKLSKGTAYMPLFMVKRVVQHFIYIKSTIQRSHEFALMILNCQSAKWICDFTSNINIITESLNLIKEEVLEKQDEKFYDLGELFDIIEPRLPSPAQRGNILIPKFVTRVILLYSRSYSIPKVDSSKASLNSLRKNPYFFIDLLYIHEPPCSENLCEEIYSEIATLDRIKFSYILEVGRDAAKLHDNMAKLLAHPLQRPPQKDVCNEICTLLASQEAYINM